MAKPRRKSPSPSKGRTPSKASPKAASRSSKPARPAARKAAKPAAKASASRGKAATPAARPKAGAKTAGKATPKAARKPAGVGSGPSAGAPGAGGRPRPVPSPPPPPPQRSTYAEALGVYVRGIQALQARKYREAADLLRSVITRFPEEKELHERATLYVRVCERQIAEAPAQPESAEDRVYAATLALNNGAVDRAISILSSVIADDDEHDQACYMLGVAYAIRGTFPAALQHLARSMALNPENRALARKEPDLEALRRTEEMRALLAAAPAPLPAKDRRAAVKKRRK